MKITLPLLIILLFGSCSASAPDDSIAKTEEEIVITISGETTGSKCARKCLRISNVNVQMDDCYDQDTEVFSKSCEVNLKDNEFYSTLLNTEISYWEKIENEIDQNSNIDSGLPFIVTITSKEETKSFILLRIDEFPTEKYGEFMGQVASIFDNWNDCPEKEK